MVIFFLFLFLTRSNKKKSDSLSFLVHFQNSAVLVDKLTQANIHNYQVQFFPDSNHAIRYHNANPNVYYLLTKFLWESFGGEEYLHVRKELNGHFAGPLSPIH